MKTGRGERGQTDRQRQGQKQRDRDREVVRWERERKNSELENL